MLYVDIEKKLDLFTLKARLDTKKGIHTIAGPSGAGKSMTLKCIAGLETPDKGVIRFNDTVFFDSEKHINLAPQKRKAGYLFQDYALFPNMNVKANIKAGLHRLKRDQRDKKAEELMNNFRIGHLKDKYPDTLSGGEQQRVALCRIFASDPEILLLDEPFSSLDTFLKWELIPSMTETLRSFDGISIMVSHDIDEIIRISDTVSEIENGIIKPAVSADEYYDIINRRFKESGLEPIGLGI